jgi:hypothetical protein
MILMSFALLSYEKVLQFGELLIVKIRDVNIDLHVKVTSFVGITNWHSLILNHFNKSRLRYTCLLDEDFSTVKVFYRLLKSQYRLRQKQVTYSREIVISVLKC